MKQKDEIRVDRDGDSSVEPEYPIRPPESPKEKKRPWKKMDKRPPVPPKKLRTCNTGQHQPAEQSTSSRPPSKTKSKKGNEGTRERQIYKIFGDHHNLQALWNAINFPLHASVDTYLQYSAQFYAIIDRLRGIDVLMYIDLPYRPIDYPVLHLGAVNTDGDGSCLFYSIWKQLFPHRETIDIAKFTRRIMLYHIYKDEQHFRQLQRQFGFERIYQDYVNEIKGLHPFCGDFALLALADLLNRPIYYYQSFLTFLLFSYKYITLTLEFRRIS